MRKLTLLRRESGVHHGAQWHHSVKVTTLLDQGNMALITSGFTLHHTALSICINSLKCSFFVLVVISITLWHVRLYHFTHLPNCRITALGKVPGFCSCVISTWPLLSGNALIQMNGAFQMKYCMGPKSAIFHLIIFGWGGIWSASLRFKMLYCWTKMLDNKSVTVDYKLFSFYF